MTVSVSDRQSSNYSGPQSSGHEYEFSFRLHDASMLYVEITDGDGVKTEADPNDYSVTLNYDQYGNPGGIVTYDLALPDGSFLRVISRLEIQQQSELTATPSYVPRNVEDALDYLAMTMQDQGRAVDEAVNVAQDAAASAASAADSAASAAAVVIEMAFPDAPSDGKLYGRKDSAWSQVESGVFMRDTWENLQAAGAAFEIPNGAIVECTDWPDQGVGVNSYWRAVVIYPTFTLLAPMSGLLLAGQSSAVTVTGVTTEEVLFQRAVKRYMLFGNQTIEIKTKLSKSDAVNAATFRVYCGKNGDISDALIQEIVFPAGDRAAVINTDAFFGDLTICSVAPVKTDGSYDVSLPYPAAVTVDDTTINDIFITATIQNSDEDLEVVLEHSSAKILVL